MLGSCTEIGASWHGFDECQTESEIMFKKWGQEPAEPDQSGTQPRIKTPDPDVRIRAVSIIGSTLRFSGELSASEDLVIDGQIEGTISHQEKNLTIGKTGKVHADIQAKVVEVYGEVTGNIRCTDIVRLHKSANVTGDLLAPRIIMEDGATFSGRIDMGKSKELRKRANLSIAETSTSTSANANLHG